MRSKNDSRIELRVASLSASKPRTQLVTAESSSGSLRSTRMRITPSAGAAQAERILVAGRLLADAEEAGERLELVGERDARTRR